MSANSTQWNYWHRDGCAGGVRAEFLSPELLVGWLEGRWPQASELLKAEARRETRRVEAGGRALLVKNFRARSRWLPDRAAAIHRTILRLQSLGVRTPASLAYARGRGHSLHVAEWLEGAEPLLGYAGRPDMEPQLLPAIEDLLMQIACLHRGGLVHGDLKWGNVLLRGDRAWLVDLDAVRRVRPGRSGARDLARFVVDCQEAGTSADFVRWAKETYARARGWDLARVDRWIADDYKKITERHRRRYGAGHRL